MSLTDLARFIRSTSFVGALALATTGIAFAQAPQADNTKVNTRDREKTAITADQQKNDAADRQNTRKIRQALMHDKSLSMYAHNVKIVSRDGQVTLKGPVRSEAEKQTVEAKAIEVVGIGHVANELSVAPRKSKS